MESMTGFGKGSASDENLKVTVELKSVNQRFLDLQFKMPKELNGQELALRKILQDALKRGRVEIFCQVTASGGSAQEVVVQKELLASALAQLKTVPGLREQELASSLAGLLAQPDFLTIQEASKVALLLPALATTALEKALAELVKTRREEGERLKEILRSNQNTFQEIVLAISQFNEEIESSHYERLKNKVTELLGADVDENRLLTEAALIIERGDIHEELDRLMAHLAAFTDLLQAQGPVGRQLDFLVQEMNREVNTLGAKSQALVIKSRVLQLKTLLEQIREQIQNIQ